MTVSTVRRNADFTEEPNLALGLARDQLDFRKAEALLPAARVSPFSALALGGTHGDTSQSHPSSKSFHSMPFEGGATPTQMASRSLPNDLAWEFEGVMAADEELQTRGGGLQTFALD